MSQFIIQGNQKLVGTVPISGAKNSAIPILIAALLLDDVVTIHNVPTELTDIKTTLELLALMGVKIDFLEESSVRLDPRETNRFIAPYDLVCTMRASILALGPLLAHYGQAEVSLPGGCAIGSRPVDMHLAGLRAMGASIEIEKGYVHARVEGRLKATHFAFDNITVNGTQNLMMAASLAEGTTILQNAAREPEVIDLANFLNTMGARVKGAGTDRIEIEGVRKLHGGEHTLIPDRIEAATYLIGAVMTQGDIQLSNIQIEPLEALLIKLEQMGAEIESEPHRIRIQMRRRPRALDMITAPYPGFPTDMQAQFLALNTIAEGISIIKETIFENRFMHVEELGRMGAKVTLKRNTAIITGLEKLTGAEVRATDLRASASLILAALVAEGETVINHIHHLERGYENVQKKLGMLGAQIEKVE
jgi:UDP-N-acetylglucosamine 1-carboxyvinyltransferase